MMPINLNRREKLFVGSGAGFLLVFLVFLFLIQPVFENRAELEVKLEQKKQILTEMRTMRRQFQSLQARSEKAKAQYQQRPAGFTLFSFMDRLAGETGFKKNISYMKPSSSVDEDTGLKMTYVELKLQDVTLEDLTSYLFRVETSEHMVRINSLTISKPGAEKGLLSVVMKAEAVEA
ncbi:MAG: type II secretion system protein GspM [Desulfobacterales bacterium]